MSERRRKAIVRRRIFIGLVALVLAVIIAASVGIGALIKFVTTDKEDGDFNSATVSSSQNTSGENDDKNDDKSSESKTSSETSSVTSSEVSSETSSAATATNKNLDADFERLLLVNGENPLPDGYDSQVRQSLVEIDAKFRNNNYVTQIHRDVYPYITAMVAAAQADGVDLKVWSPFRSYAIQNDLFQKQVARVGGDEQKAATVVARPGTSEHNTGLCADFNMASDSFESTPMYTWMKENAEDYGFVLRYPANKIDITGVIYESWHWRFVGINAAKEMNSLGLTLEEYVEYRKIKPQAELN